MDLQNTDIVYFTQGQSINRDGSLQAVCLPRPETDGKETTATDTADHTPKRANPRCHKAPFFDGKNRNSTDIALSERHRQQDIGPRTSSFRDCGVSLFDNDGPRNVYETLQEVENSNKNLRERLSKMESELRTVNGEKREIASEVGVQNQVNRDLKKLLVASMGADLQSQLEHLSTERAQLAQDLDNTIRTLTSERETLERVNIQCDVWRSKFLGSRLQVDEAVASRTHLDMVLQEACFALKKLLEERNELRMHMINTQRLLNYLSNALQRAHSLSEEAKTSSNVLTLALLNEQVASMISKRLLDDVGHSQQQLVGKPSGFQLVEWTSAEMLAKDIVLNRQPSLKLEQLRGTLSSPPPIAEASKTPIASRYHPQTKYDNLTVNCCKYCTGDIKLV